MGDVDVVLATAATERGAPAVLAWSRPMIRSRNKAAPGKRWPAAAACCRPGVGHCDGRAKRAGGAGEDPAGDQLQERGGAGHAQDAGAHLQEQVGRQAGGAACMEAYRGSARHHQGKQRGTVETFTNGSQRRGGINLRRLLPLNGCFRPIRDIALALSDSYI